jgi:adenylate cyclase
LPKDAVRPPPQPTRSSRRHALWSIGAITLVCVLIGTGGLWWPWLSREIAVTSATPVVAPRRSIVVLPFANLSNDPKQQYFSDAVTEDLTTALSRISNMFVISADSAFTYRDKPVNSKQIGRDLGVRYILEGSAQRTGDQIRINAQWVDAQIDAHLWADRFDREKGDLFDLQDEITSQIALALDLALNRSEANRPTAHPDALGYIIRKTA